MKRGKFFFIIAAIIAAVYAETKPQPVRMPAVEWDRTFLTPSRKTFDNERELYLSWQYASEAATSTLHISKRPVDDSADWVDIYTGAITGFAEVGSDVRMGEWFGIVSLDEKLYIWVEYVPPPIVHTNGVYHLSGVYHALDTNEPKYVAPTVEVKRIDDNGEEVVIDDDAWENFIKTINEGENE